MGVCDQAVAAEAETTHYPVALSALVTSQLPFSLPNVREEGERNYNHKDFFKNYIFLDLNYSHIDQKKCPSLSFLSVLEDATALLSTSCR